MKNLFTIVLLCLYFNSCKTDNVSKIRINVKSIKILNIPSNEELCPKLEIELNSKSNIINLTEVESSISSYIFCPLNTHDFSSNNISVEKYKLYGTFPQEIKGKFNTLDSSFDYSLTIGFVDKDYNLLSRDIVTSIIGEKECIECKLVFSYFPKRIKQNTFSDIFCIPVDKIINEIK